MKDLLTAMKLGLIEGLVKYTKDNQRMATPKEIAVTLLAMSYSTSKKTNLPYPKALSVIMVEACKYDRELAHAAIDDAFDAYQKSQKAKKT